MDKNVIRSSPMAFLDVLLKLDPTYGLFGRLIATRPNLFITTPKPTHALSGKRDPIKAFSLSLQMTTIQDKFDRFGWRVEG